MTGNLTINRVNTGTSNLNSIISAGNNIPVGTVGSSRGLLTLYSYSDKQATIYPENLTADRYAMIPDKTGTIALREDFNVNITETRFYLARPQGLTLIEASLPFVGRKPSSVSVTNVKYYNGSTWANLTVESTSIMDNCIIVECTVPTGFEQGKVYWGQAQIVATYS